jgi:hypothetical protein
MAHFVPDFLATGKNRQARSSGQNGVRMLDADFRVSRRNKSQPLPQICPQSHRGGNAVIPAG